MLASSFGHGGDGEVCCLRAATGTGEDASALVASAANTDRDGSLLDLDDEEEEMLPAGQKAEGLAGDEEDDDGDGDRIRWIREAFGMYEMEEGAGCVTALGLKLVLARLGAHRDIADCQAVICRFDMDGDGVLCFDEFRAMMMHDG